MCLKEIPEELYNNILNHDSTSIIEIKPPKVITIEKKIQIHRLLHT